MLCQDGLPCNAPIPTAPFPGCQRLTEQQVVRVLLPPPHPAHLPGCGQDGRCYPVIVGFSYTHAQHAYARTLLPYIHACLDVRVPFSRTRAQHTLPRLCHHHLPLTTGTDDTLRLPAAVRLAGARPAFARAAPTHRGIHHTLLPHLTPGTPHRTPPRTPTATFTLPHTPCLYLPLDSTMDR